ncbi:MAG TPA: radical SAM protein [Polyangia bacterium]|jgi:radical SAM protein with 4Fe4S-binding SPASM domain
MLLLDDSPGGVLEPEAHRVIRDPSAGLDRPERRDAFRRLAAGHHTVKLHLTPACNLRCRNCYNDATSRNDLTRAEIFGLLDQLRGRPCRLDLLGGEPLLHPEVLEVIRYAREDVGLPSVFLYTNGTRVDDALAARLAAAGLDTAIVSLHGPAAPVHEAMTGAAGSFDLTCRGIAALARAGVRAYSFTVACAANAARLAEMPAFTKSLGGAALFFPYVPQRENDELAITDPAALRAALTHVIRHSFVFRASLLRSIAEGCKLCRAFTQTVTIFADGTVTPCPFTPLPIGNIRRAPLYDILEGAYAHPGLADFLADPPECRDCRIRGVCGGGCKAGRITVHGDARGRDLNCLHGPFADPVTIGALPDALPYVY